jgi:hypothetical protein
MNPSCRFAIVLSLSVLAGIVAAPARAESDLARAYRVIQGKQLVDLTHSFDSTTPVWSGFGEAKMTPAVDPKTQRPYTIKEDGFRATITRWSASTAPMSIRPRISTRTGSPWTRSRSSR